MQATAPALSQGQNGAPGLGAEGSPLGQPGAAQSPGYSESLPADASGMMISPLALVAPACAQALIQYMLIRFCTGVEICLNGI